MFADNSDTIAETMIKAEYYNAVTNYGAHYPDVNTHKKVEWEEIQESFIEISSIQQLFILWEVNKENPEKQREILNNIIERCKSGMKELAQVAAVCLKGLNGYANTNDM